MLLLIALTLPPLQASHAGSDTPTPESESAGPAIESESIRTEDGYRLPYQRWGPTEKPKAVVLALHGLNDYSGGMAYAAQALAEHEIAVYAYDQRGFGANDDAGLWPGEETLIHDAASVLKLLAKRYPDTPRYLMGHSMGGAIALILMTRQEPPTVTGTALLAPAVWGRKAMPWYQRGLLWLTARLLPGLQLSSEVAGVAPTDDPEVLENMRTDPLIRREVRADTLAGVTDLMDRALAATSELESRVIILYGEQDEVIPPEPTCLMLRRLPQDPANPRRLVLYPQGYHMLTRDQQRERVHADLAAWFLDPDRDRLPSGLETSRTQVLSELCPSER
ncbi:MAG: alpha/beta fold hydrolase [Halorhodospira sp.]